MIRQMCGGCGQELTIPDEYAGTTGRCNKCGASIVVTSGSNDTGEIQAVLAESGQTRHQPSKGPKPLILFGWLLFLATAVTAVLAQFQLVKFRWNLALMIFSLGYLLLGLFQERVSRKRMILWIGASTLLYYFVFPLYLFGRQFTRKLISIPISLLIAVLLGFALLMPYSDKIQAKMSTLKKGTTVEQENSPRNASAASAGRQVDPEKQETGKNTETDQTDADSSSSSVGERLGVDLSRVAKFKVKGIYLGMNESDAITTMKGFLGEGFIYDKDNPLPGCHLFVNPSGGTSAMEFKDGILMKYGFSAEMVDHLFKTAALDVKSFAQQFIDSYGLEEMTVDHDAQGDECLVHRNQAGFSVTIYSDKTLKVELLMNAGKPTFD